jgi:ABC-type multidrug transport system permease subunit
LLSTIFSEQTTAMQCAIGSFYPMLLLSGILWPIEGMPAFLRQISWYLPCTAACQAMRDIMARGWDVTQPSVYLGIVSTSSWILIFILASWVAMKLRR